MTVEKHVLLVGAGHAHLQLLEWFAERRAPACRLTVVADMASTVYSGMVPGFVAGHYQRQDLQIDVIALARAAQAETIIARAVSIDPARTCVGLDDGAHVEYDLASFNIGSRLGGCATPGVPDQVLPVRPMTTFMDGIDALTRHAQAQSKGTPLRVTIVGGGAAGVELAFTLHHRLERDTGVDPHVLVLEAGRDILPGYPRSLVGRVHKRAKEKRIDLRSSWRVRAVGRAWVVGEGDARIPHDAVVWAAGSSSFPLFRESGLSTDDQGFVRVGRTLQVEHEPTLFAAGDCASLVGYPLLPKAGVFAVRQAPTLMHNLKAALTGAPLRLYTPQSDFLTLLNLGDGRAIGTKWGRSVYGKWVMMLKDRIDRRFVRRFHTVAG